MKYIGFFMRNLENKVNEKKWGVYLGGGGGFGGEKCLQGVEKETKIQHLNLFVKALFFKPWSQQSSRPG